MIKHKEITLLFLLTIALAACSFVSLDPEARDVAVSNDATSLKNCNFLGNTTVSLWSSASTFQSNTKVADQLDTLARNQAATMGGNVVISNSAITNSQETYRVYKCMSSHNTNNAPN